MSREYGSTMGFFLVDHVTLQYLKLTGRSDDTPQQERMYSSYLELDLVDIEPCFSRPKRPHDQVPLKEMKSDWHSCLDNKVGFKEAQEKVAKFSFHGESAKLKHGSVVIAAITSCTNTSNPSVMLGAGLVPKKAYELGLKVKPWIKTSLAPDSGVVTKYLVQSGLQKYLSEQGFNAGFSEVQLMDCAKLLARFHGSMSADQKLKGIYKKYSTLEKGSAVLLQPAKSLLAQGKTI